MRAYLDFAVEGAWVAPAGPVAPEPTNPATEQVSGRIELGSPAVVDRAVAAARRVFAGLSS